MLHYNILQLNDLAHAIGGVDLVYPGNIFLSRYLPIIKIFFYQLITGLSFYPFTWHKWHIHMVLIILIHESFLVDLTVYIKRDESFVYRQ